MTALSGGIPAIILTAAVADVGTRYPTERRSFRDAATGVRITAITTHKADDDKIYQTHPSWTADGKYVVFHSDRTGTWQLFAYQVGDGEIVQITDHPDTNRGQVYLDRRANVVYHAKGRSIVAMDLDKVLAWTAFTEMISPPRYEQRIWTLPDGWALSGTFTVDADGKSLYVGLGSPEDKAWAIHQVNIETGRTLHVTPLAFRVGHLQANPRRAGVLMFCHETGGDAPQRMYLMRKPGGDPEPFYRETYDEWVTHEVWFGPDRALFTIWPKNEEMRKKPYGIASVELADRSHAVLSRFPYWHVCGLSGGRYAVGDTMAGELFLVDLTGGRKKLLTKGHRPEGAKAHAHQSGSPDGRQVLFCSGMFGNRDLMLLDVPEWDALP